MNYKKTYWAFGIVVVLLLAFAISASFWAKATPVADPILRLPLAPAGFYTSNVSQQTGSSTEAIEPVVVNLSDIPANVYDPNNLYDRWLRGEVDLREYDYRISEQEVLDKQVEAMALAPHENIQIAQSGPGLNAPVLGISFDSLDRADCCGGGSVVPPDPIMAAGPNHLVAIVNLAFEIYDKTGTSLAGPTTMASFFASVGTGCASNPFDPNVLYDEETDRWIIAADGAGTHYCIAVSQSGNPTGAYNLYSVPAQPVGGEFHDYPHTGVGDTYIVAGANQFGGAIPGGFEGRVWAFDKNVMYSGGVLTPVTFSTGFEGTPQPLHLHGFGQGTWPSMGSTHYFATDPYDGCTVNIWQWNIPAAPTIVSTYNLCTETGIPGGFPVNFPQSGGNNIQANDWRMREFEYRNGYGWIADSISCNPGSGTVDCVRWHQVNLSGTPALVQAGVYASNGEYRTFPDLAVNHCNDMVVGYTKSSSSTFPGVWYTGRENADPPGTLQAEAMLKAGEITYTAFDTPPHRWGDYTGMTIDPDGQTFWYLGQYSKNITGSARWGNYIGSFTYPGCGGGPNPDIELTKTVGTDPGVCATTDVITVTQDTDVTYCYTVENTGNISFTLHTLDDSELGSLLLDFPYVLVPGASAFITETANILSTTVNTATWTADNPSIPSSATAIDTATVIVLPPEIAVDPTEFIVTQAITSVMTYTLNISNVGGSDLQWTVDEELPIVNIPTGSDPHRQGGATPRTTPVDIDSFLGPIVADGGFEAGTPSPFWNEASTNFGTPLCDAGCGFGGGSGPHSGSWWAWFGGISAYEEGSVDQNVTLPSGSATLSFWLEVPVACTNPTDYLEVLIDGTQVFLVDGTSSLCGVVGYSLQTVYISAFADGGVHNLEFHSEIFGGGVTNFFVDDVSIDITGPPPVCSTLTDIPWASVSPSSGTTASGDSADVMVTFDTTLLTVGNTYTATLCVTSNDPVTPLVTVPVTLTVVDQSFGVDLSSNQVASADAGTTVVYTLTITNTGNVVDTFDLSATGVWAAVLSQTSITLAPGASATFTVEVSIPGDALDGDVDVTTVTATSQTDGTAADSATLTTTAIVIEPEGNFIYLPIVVR